MAAPRTRVVLHLLALALLTGPSACASGGGSSSGAARGPGDRITPEELAEWASRDVYQLIQRLRPRWLQNRAPVTAQGRAPIAIIVDGVRQQGGPELLRNFRAGDVDELSYLNARDATTRWGTDMTAGAIVVVTKH